MIVALEHLLIMPLEPGFAIEMFVYHTDLTGQQTYFSDVHSDTDGVYFYKTSTNTLSLYDNNNQVFTAGTIELNKWHHIALTRSGGVVRGFIDGVKVAEVADAHNYTQTQYNIGDSHGSSSGEMVGYISNVRVLKGSALYTANFTPPTTTLTNITNTVLLCCQDSDELTAPSFQVVKVLQRLVMLMQPTPITHSFIIMFMETLE